MAETFDTVQTNAATTAGANLAGDTFTQSATSKFVPASYLVYGAAGGPYERVDTATPLPVTIISGTPSLNCEYADGATWSDGSSKGILNSGVYQATPQTIADGKIGPVQVTANGYQIVYVNGGSVTANAGTNLNTSALALESGGNLAGAATSLAVIDDWDETNRCAVNLIASQVAITGGAGSVAANTPRVTLASDDPLVVSGQIIDDWDESDRAKVNIIVGQAGVTAGAGAVAAGTPRVTLASDDPAVAKLGTIDTDTGNIATSCALLDNVVYVDDADWTDGASSHALVGGLYQSSPQSITDGDVGPLQVTQNGYLIVSVNGTVTVGSHAVTNAGTFAVQVTGDALTALQLIDNSIVADDAAFTPGTTSVNMAGFTFDDSSPDTVNEGDAGAARMSANRCIYVNVRDNAGNERGLNIDASGQLAVTLASAQTLATVTNLATIGTSVTPGTSAAHLGKAVDSAAGGTDTGVAILAVRDDALSSLTPVEGDYNNLRVDANGALWTLGTSDVAMAASLSVMDDWDNGASDGASVSGDVAHDAADAGEPVKVGMKAIAHGATPTEVAELDRTNWYANRAGVPFVIGGHPNVKCHAVLVTDANGAQTDQAMFTVAAGTKIVVTRLSICLDGATTAETNVRVGFGTSTLTTPNTSTAGTSILFEGTGFGTAAGGGANVINIGDGSGILGIGADGAEIRYTVEDPAAGNIGISVSYYEVSS